MLGHQPSLDGIFSALGDPTRRAIVERLTGREATVSELAKPFDMSLSAVHQHLALLEGVGLVACEKRGRERVPARGEGARPHRQMGFRALAALGAAARCARRTS